MHSKVVINKLQRSRRERFVNYDNINLTCEAVEILKYLFLNPDCQSDIDFLSFSGDKIKLSDLGEHIITAAPSTLAQYAEKHNIKAIGKNNILSCFALDHIDEIERHKIDKIKNPAYALGHILNFSRVSDFCSVKSKKISVLKSKIKLGTVIFKNVLVPDAMVVEKNQYVWHHFGVVVAIADNDKFIKQILNLQKQNEFIIALFKYTKQKKITIDFAEERIFQKNILGQMLDNKKVKPIKKPQDLEKGKIKFQN